jgi:TM2 domain-containing membrane protein YozV
MSDRPDRYDRSDRPDDFDRPERRDRYDREDRPARRDRGDRLPPDVANTKMVAGLLAILLGGWGVHKFYLGFTGTGVLQLVITLVTCGLGGIIALVEGILYLTKSDEDFYRTYIVEKKQWF